MLKLIAKIDFSFKSLYMRWVVVSVWCPCLVLTGWLSLWLSLSQADTGHLFSLLSPSCNYKTWISCPRQVSQFEVRIDQQKRKWLSEADLIWWIMLTSNFLHFLFKKVSTQVTYSPHRNISTSFSVSIELVKRLYL